MAEEESDAEAPHFGFGGNDGTPTAVQPEAEIEEVILDTDEIDPYEEGDYQLDEGGEDDGFLPQAHREVCIAVQELLAKRGLVGSKLALQDGEEPEILTQALRELNLQISYEARGYVLHEMCKWVAKAIESEPMRKRQRGDGTRPGLARLWDCIEYCRSGHSSGSSGKDEDVLVVPRPGVRDRRPRTVPQLAGEEEARRREEEMMMNKLCETLAGILIEVGSPSARQAESTNNPRRALMGIMGKTRLNTARKYLRIWTVYSEWLQAVKKVSWPTEVGHLLEYLYVLKDEPCAPSVPGSWYQALVWIFKKGGYDISASIISSNLLRQNLDSLLVELSAGQSPVLQAARFPILVLAALEAYVHNEKHPPIKRVYAGSLLFRAWATLRFDDMQRMSRRLIRFRGGLLVTTLLSTKTTGPGKRVRQLPVAVSEDAQILPLSWLTTFLELLQTHMARDRDFLLDYPSPDFRGTRDRRLNHSQASALTRMVMGELRVPKLEEGGWVESEAKAVPEELADLFGEHSGRAVLPSMSIYIEGDKSKRDCLGRWKPSASDDYVRTYQSVVAALQVRVAKAIQKGHTEMCQEHDVVDRASRHLRERKGLGDVENAKICDAWSLTLESFVGYLHSKFMWNEAAESQPISLLIQADAAKVQSIAGKATGKIRNRVAREGRFLITYSKNGRVSRLHSTEKKCYWAGVEVKDCRVVDEISEDMYNRRCKFCWPELLPKLDAPVPEEGETDSSVESDE
jgi:hypothetical protein